MFHQLLIAGLLVLALQASPTQLLPVDEASTRPDFFSFRASLQTAIARRDTSALLAVVHPQIRVSFGANNGIAEFRRMWKIDDPKSQVWEVLGTVLALGGSFQDENTFVAPYVFSRWPERFESFEHIVVIGANVRVRSQPDTSASTIDSVSFALLRVPRQSTDKEGWTAVQLATNRVGYIASAYVRSPLDYRAFFRYEDRRWRLVTLVAGD